MFRGLVAILLFGTFACGVKAPPLPPLISRAIGREASGLSARSKWEAQRNGGRTQPFAANEARAERLLVHARRVGGEWWVRAAFPRFARFTITRRGADCPGGRTILATDGTTREIEVREAVRGEQRFTVVAVTTTGERFERVLEIEETTK